MKTKLLFLSLLLTTAIGLSQVIAGQVDDFEDGTTQLWRIGSAAGPSMQPMNISSGGPDGADDNFLQYSSTGVDEAAGGKMLFYNSNFAGNTSQWTSNYIAQGIVAIKMDVNVSVNDLNLRIAVQGNGTQMCTTNAVPVSAGSGWTSVIIPISPSDFTIISGSSTASSALTSISQIRILSNESPGWSSDVNEIQATLGVDNITASTTLSTQELALKNEFEISPNPATSKLNINLSTNLDNANVTVYDVLGKKVYSAQMNSLSSSIDVSKWNTGVYLVRVSTNTQTLTKRFVKQ